MYCSAITSDVLNPLQMSLRAPLRADWSRCVLEFEYLSPHHSWQLYVRIGMIVDRVSILSCECDIPLTMFPRIFMAQIVLVALAVRI